MNKSNRIGRGTGHWQSWTAIALIILLALLFLFPALRMGVSSVIGRDTCDIMSVLPLHEFARSELRQGRFPHWNPYANSGYPLHAEGEAAVFYPVNLLSIALPTALGINISALLHLAAAGIFLFLYIREIGFHRAPALFAALCFMFSSGPVSRLYAGHVSNYANLVLLPALLWLWEKWKRTQNKGTLIGIAAAYACLALAGSPQFLFYTSLYLGFMVLCDLLAAKREEFKYGLLRAGWFAAALFCGALLGAVQTLPTLDFASYSHVQQAMYEYCAQFSFAPENFLTLLAPGFFGDSLDNSYWGRNYLWEMWIYIGVFPLALAGLGCARDREAHTLKHIWAIPVFVLLALGGHTPLLGILCRWVPGFGLFRGNAKFILYVQISLCILAAGGAQKLLHPLSTEDSRRNRRHLMWSLTAMIVLVLCLVGFLNAAPDTEGSPWRKLLEWRFARGEMQRSTFIPDTPKRATEAWNTTRWSLIRTTGIAAIAITALSLWRRFGHRSAWSITVLFALAVPELWLFSRPYVVTTKVNDSAIEEEFLSVLRTAKEPARVYSNVSDPNAFTTARQEMAAGYTSMISKRYNNFLTAVNGYPRGMSMSVGPGIVSPQFFRANVKYLIMREEDEVPADLAEPLVRSDGKILYLVKGAYPRAYFSQMAMVMPDLDTTVGAVESRKVDIRALDLVESKERDLLAGIGAPANTDRVEFIERLPNRVSLLTAVSSPRLLVLADAYDPNWRCFVDGKSELEILPINIAFRGVIVPDGEHRIEFSYEPVSFCLGTVISLAALFFLSAITIVLCRKRSKSVRISGN